MLYIKKSQPSKEVADEISRVRREQKSLMIKGTPDSVRKVFDCLSKPLLRASLIVDQHGLCAYCMRRIENGTNMTIDHWQPIERNVDGALDYKNMFGVCDGGRRIYKSATDGSHRVLCCDASKGSRAITINPCKSEHMMKIRYSEDGRIYTYPKDEELETDINEVLHLNGYDGIDTQTRIIKGRREAYKSYVRYIMKLIQDNSLSRRVVEKRIQHIESQEKYGEFAGVILYFLKRKLKQL